MNKASKIALEYFLMIMFVSGIFFVFVNSGFVFAVHMVNFTDGSIYLTIDEDVVTSLINITVNNSDSGPTANITELNITLPSSFIFINNSNDSSGPNTATTFFSNSSSYNLRFYNYTEFIVNSSNSTYFWFNVSAITPGNYTINATTVNSTTTQNFSIYINVNDTTLPLVASGTGTPANASNLSQDFIYLNASVTELFESVIMFELHNSSDLVNRTMFNDSTRVINWTSLADDNYYINISVNDTTGNLNISNLTINLDTTVPDLTALSPVNNSIHNATLVMLNISANEYLDFCKFSLDDWITNVSLDRHNSTSFYNNTYAFSNGTQVVRVWCNDSSNNINSTFINVFTMRHWQFSGYTYDINGTALNNSIINVTIRDTSFSVVGYNATTSNASGWFNFSVAGNPGWFYQPVVRHFQNNASDDGSEAIDSVGQSMPAFPYAEMASGLNMNLYLRNAGTINITVTNGTSGEFRAFSYQIKDQTLNFPIHESWTEVDSVVAYVPRNRNYSIMIYPNDSMPLSFDWNNFTSSSSYNLTDDNTSFYNVSSFTLDKQFNTTMNFVTINGTIFNSSDGNASGWDEFQVVAFLMEAGEIIYLGSNSLTFYNMSAWDGGKADILNNNTGYYNITVPGPTEGASFLLFASARNGTSYYGGYRNVTSTYSSGSIEANFTMYPLMSTDWGSTNSNITVKEPLDFASIGINTSKQVFNIVNSTNSTFNNVEASIEVTLDYTNYNATKFTFMSSLEQGSASSFYFPLINATGIEEMNVYSMSGAPRRIGGKTVQQILDGANNVTLSAFNPGAIDGSIGTGSISISIYKSNSTCDVPSPPASCVLTSSTTMSTFNPLSAVMGGGAISFRMGVSASGIEIHYVNVDMIASGPPDVAFDSSATTSTSGSFDSVMRFGSGGPTIYDYVLVSMPYTPGSTSVAGLNESNDVNMSIPTLYDEDWNVIWDVTNNGSNGSALAGNHSHYNTYSSEWETLMSPSNCTNNVSLFNSTNPCYIDKTNNKVWIRLPHFSGTRPDLDGTVTTVTSSGSNDDSSSSGSSGVVYWRLTKSITDEEFKNGITKDLGTRERVKFDVGDEEHSIGVISMTSNTAVINVSSSPQQATFSIGDLRKFDVTDDGYYDVSVVLDSISSNKASLTIKEIREKVTEESEVGEQDKEDDAVEQKAKDEAEKKSLFWLWIIFIFGLVVVVGVVVYYFIKKK
jgi:hypothetical protein